MTEEPLQRDNRLRALGEIENRLRGLGGPRDAGLLGRSNASFYYSALPKVFEVGTGIKLTDLRGNDFGN